jgi:hypothetical protein
MSKPFKEEHPLGKLLKECEKKEREGVMKGAREGNI